MTVQKGNFSLASRRRISPPAGLERPGSKKENARSLDLVGCHFFITGGGWPISNVWERFESNWIKALIYWIVMSAVIMLFYVCSSYFSLFFKFRQTEREVRKLIYQDILYQLSKEEN